jgi:hypothetical protein
MAEKEKNNLQDIIDGTDWSPLWIDDDGGFTKILPWLSLILEVIILIILLVKK